MFDKAGYVLNDIFTQLSPNNLLFNETASGLVSLSIMSGDVFGWYVDSSDGVAGRGFLSVDAVTTPSAVPVPAALPLMASALGAFCIARRRKQ